MHGLDNIININEAARRLADQKATELQVREENNAVLGEVAVTQRFTDGSIGTMIRMLDGKWAYVHAEAQNLEKPPILQQIPAWSARDWCEQAGMPSRSIDAWFGEEPGHPE